MVRLLRFLLQAGDCVRQLCDEWYQITVDAEHTDSLEKISLLVFLFVLVLNVHANVPEHVHVSAGRNVASKRQEPFYVGATCVSSDELGVPVLFCRSGNVLFLEAVLKRIAEFGVTDAAADSC